jgi:hypothetical protein
MVMAAFLLRFCTQVFKALIKFIHHSLKAYRLAEAFTMQRLISNVLNDEIQLTLSV